MTTAARSIGPNQSRRGIIPSLRRHRQERRVVVTGIGVVSPHGSDLRVFWDAMLSGYSCIRRLSRIDTADYPVGIGGQVAAVQPTSFLPEQLIRRNDLFTNIGLYAGGLALESSGLGALSEDKRPISVVVGTAFGAMQGLEEVYGSYFAHGWRKMHPLAVPRNMFNSLGHTMGASGALEVVATLLSIREGIIPPTINYETPDPACNLDYVPNQARRQQVRTAIKNSFAFGGENAVLVLRDPEEVPQ
jgi:3-oxoacyl-(acyl-carrier-protein) synthase